MKIQSRKLFKTTSNSNLYNKLYYKKLENKAKVCGYCGFNKGCNRHRKDRPNRSWKEYRKTQYKS